MGRRQVVRQWILIPPYGGSNPPAPASFYAVESGASRTIRFFILNAVTHRVLNGCCYLVRQRVSVTLAGCRQHPRLSPLRISRVAFPGAMGRKGAALAFGEFRLFKFS